MSTETILYGNFDSARVPGRGIWICKCWNFGGRWAMFTRHRWRWAARLNAFLYENINLSPLIPRASVFRDECRASPLQSPGERKWMS